MAGHQPHAEDFPPIKGFPITDIPGDFPDAKKHFIGEGGEFDAIY